MRLKVHLGWAVAALLLGGCYLLFAGQVSAHELIALAIALAPALILAALMRAASEHALAFEAPWLFVAGRVLAGLLTDSWKVGRVLLGCLVSRRAGDLVRQPFEAGNRRSATAAGRRALVTLAISLTPNRFVVDLESDRLLLHCLLPEPPKSDRMWPL